LHRIARLAFSSSERPLSRPSSPEGFRGQTVQNLSYRQAKTWRTRFFVNHCNITKLAQSSHIANCAQKRNKNATKIEQKQLFLRTKTRQKCYKDATKTRQRRDKD
jgi:hypothetical protein